MLPISAATAAAATPTALYASLPAATDEQIENQSQKVSSRAQLLTVFLMFRLLFAIISPVDCNSESSVFQLLFSGLLLSLAPTYSLFFQPSFSHIARLAGPH